MPIGFFQLDNLIRQRIRFFLFSEAAAESLGFDPIYNFFLREIHQDWSPANESFESLLLRLQELKATKEAPLVFICERGEKSKHTVEKLVEAGYINAFYALGGREELLKGP